MRPAELKTIAIYHASFQVVKRSAGRSAVAAIAYRSAERLVDERTGEIHDYSRKRGVDDTFILAPDDAPDWATNRSKLWSAVELGEKRKDAQLARELNVALPIELSDTESTQLIKAYVQSAFVDMGMVADVALHELDSDNPHAHVMLTMRVIDADGFGPKNRDWNAKDQLVEWREGWETAVNDQLSLGGHEARVDHRSLRDQGIDRLPSAHMGPHASAMEKRGVATLKGDHNRLVAKLNERLAEIGLAIEQGLSATRDLAAEAKAVILKGLSKGGSVLQPSVERADAKKVLERERKDRERSLDRSRGPSLGR